MSTTQIAPFGPLVLRLGLAAVFFAHSLTKLFVFTLPGTARFFEAHGFPGWTAYPVTALEFFGAVTLLLGFQTRATALVLVAVLFGALKVHAPNGWMFDHAGGGWEYVAFLMVALSAQAMLGSGAYALSLKPLELSRASAARSLP